MSAAQRNLTNSGVISKEDPRTNVLGKYRLIAELGRGGMAEVFLALVRGPAGFNKLMVIKRLRPHLSEEAEFLQMFLDEARLAAKLSHPNIVQTIEVGEDNGQYFISMEYLEGQPLNRILRRCGDQVTMAMALRILCDALAGLHHAHELTDYDGSALSVVHRDATPHNIFVTYNGQVKVVDFGIAKAAISVAETRTGVLKGKVSYMAPEQARGEEVDRRADLFSIGCCMWEVLTGQRVWKGKSDIQVLNAIMNNDQPIPSPRSLRPDIPSQLEEICLKALAFDREVRHQTAIELKRDIETFLASIGDGTTVSSASRIVSDRFVAERNKLRSLIDAQVKSAHDLSTGEYDRVNLPRLPAGPPSLASLHPGEDSGSVETPATASGNRERAPMSLTTASLAPPAPAVSYRVPALVAACIALGGIIGAVLIARSGEAPKAPAEQASAPAEQAPKEPVAAAPRAVTPPPATDARVEISITVTPSRATIAIDGAEVAGNPFTGSFPKDDKKHLVRVEAKGYEAVEREVDFSRNITLELSLKKEAAGGVVATRPSPARVEAPAPPSQGGEQAEPAPQPAPKPTSLLGDPPPRKTRTIDENNPYQK
jgi:eukaryotic-like serine/threonine-protein kinase